MSANRIVRWMAIVSGGDMTGISAGAEQSLAVMFRPGADIMPGVYNDSITIYADNHLPFTYNIQATVTSDRTGSVLFDVLNEFYEDVAGARITVQNQSLPELLYSVTTASDGSVMLYDIPDGRYVYNISPPPGHLPYGGTFAVQPGLTTAVPVALEMNLVNIEWSVTETMISDTYQINIEQVFQTKVPAPVVVIEPGGVNVPQLAPGETFNGEFTVSNYGLIEVYDVGMTFPESYEDYEIKIFTELLPEKLAAMQSVRIPYRITRKAASAVQTADLYAEVCGYGGFASCVSGLAAELKCNSVICPNSDHERVGSKLVNFVMNFMKECLGIGDDGGGDDGASYSSGNKSGFGSDGPVEIYFIEIQSCGGGGEEEEEQTCDASNCTASNECDNAECVNGTCNHTPIEGCTIVTPPDDGTPDDDTAGCATLECYNAPCGGCTQPTTGCMISLCNQESKQCYYTNTDGDCGTQCTANSDCPSYTCLTGTCSAGACAYAEIKTGICASVECTGNSDCPLRTCQTGTCSAGACSYAATTTGTCAEGDGGVGGGGSNRVEDGGSIEVTADCETLNGNSCLSSSPSFISTENVTVEWIGYGNPDSTVWSCRAGNTHSGNCSFATVSTGRNVVLRFEPAGITDANAGRAGALEYIVEAENTANGVVYYDSVTITQDNLDVLRQEYVDYGNYYKNSLRVPARSEFDQELPMFPELLGLSSEPSIHDWHILRGINELARLANNRYIISYDGPGINFQSGYRCPKGNYPLVRDSNGSPTSNHQYGEAFDFDSTSDDIVSPEWQLYYMYKAAIDAGATGGTYLYAFCTNPPPNQPQSRTYFARNGNPPTPDNLPSCNTSGSPQYVYTKGHAEWQ